MSPPRDYVLDAIPASAHKAPFGMIPAHVPGTPEEAPLTVATLFERHQASLPITEAMIDDACRTLRAAESLLES